MTLREDVRYEAAAMTLTAVVALLEDAGASPALIEDALRLKIEITRERFSQTLVNEPANLEAPAQVVA